jgi:hypothetical protein
VLVKAGVRADRQMRAEKLIFWSHDLLKAEAAGRPDSSTSRKLPLGLSRAAVFDLDGHVLRFGSETPEGAPRGQWLDEEGVWWQAQPDGSWTRA